MGIVSIYTAASGLERAISALATVRGGMAARLPLDAAELEMNDIEDHIEIVSAKLGRALAVLETEIDRQEADVEVEPMAEPMRVAA